jgi:hypothetical protein
MNLAELKRIQEQMAEAQAGGGLAGGTGPRMGTSRSGTTGGAGGAGGARGAGGGR